MVELTVVSSVEWLWYCARPLDVVADAVATQRSEGRRAFIVKFWVAPIVVTLLFNIPVLKSLSIDVDRSAFAIATLLLSVSLNQVFGGIILISIIKIFNIKAESTVALACYTLFVVYSPVTAIFGLPASYSRGLIVAGVKAQQLGLMDSFSYFLRGLAKPAEDSIVSYAFYIGMNNVFALMNWALSMVESVIAAECLAKLTDVTRFRAYLAVTAASFLFVLPGIVAMFLQLIVIWTWTK